MERIPADLRQIRKVLTEGEIVNLSHFKKRYVLQLTRQQYNDMYSLKRNYPIIVSSSDHGRATSTTISSLDLADFDR